jgi:tRNA U34 5-carboxymethylaminomethyl modifying GTPase MnmE/TrmE
LKPKLAPAIFASAAVESADLVLVVVDEAGDEQAFDPPISTPALRVLNKIDLRPTSSQAAELRFDVRTSALTGEGIADLVAAIGLTLVPSPPAAGAAVPFTTEQIAQFDAAGAAIFQRDGAAATGCLERLLH